MAESTGPVIIKGPVDKLHFRSLVGVEQLSQPVRYDVEFLHGEATLVAQQLPSRLCQKMTWPDVKRRWYPGRGSADHLG